MSTSHTYSVIQGETDNTTVTSKLGIRTPEISSNTSQLDTNPGHSSGNLEKHNAVQ